MCRRGWVWVNRSTRTDYLLHDPQFSPVVVLEDTGRLSERIDYWANGLPRHHHMGDVDGDGDRGSDDQGFINNPTNQVSIGNAAYHAEADINRDGTINSTDYGFVSSATFTALPLGRLSDVKVFNNVGFCGYRYEAITKLYQVRFREFDPFRGRWLQRDPAGYMDSNNLYGYVSGNPIGWLDPFGLQGGGGVPINSSDPTQFGSFPPPRAYWAAVLINEATLVPTVADDAPPVERVTREMQARFDQAEAEDRASRRPPIERCTTTSATAATSLRRSRACITSASCGSTRFHSAPPRCPQPIRWPFASPASKRAPPSPRAAPLILAKSLTHPHSQFARNGEYPERSREPKSC